MFKTDYDNTMRQGVQPGEYEIIIQKAELEYNNNGKECVLMPLVVRNDVDQKSQNGIIFHRVRPSKETGEYSPKIVNSILKACRVPAGTEFDTALDALLSCKGLAARVVLEEEDYEDNIGVLKKRNTVKPWGWRESNYDTCRHVWKRGFDDAGGGIGHDISFDEKELPF